MPKEPEAPVPGKSSTVEQTVRKSTHGSIDQEDPVISKLREKHLAALQKNRALAGMEIGISAGSTAVSVYNLLKDKRVNPLPAVIIGALAGKLLGEREAEKLEKELKNKSVEQLARYHGIRPGGHEKSVGERRKQQITEGLAGAVLSAAPNLPFIARTPLPALVNAYLGWSQGVNKAKARQAVEDMLRRKEQIKSQGPYQDYS